MIHFVTALAPEARPLIRHYRMERLEGAFPTYRSEEAALVVSGIGRVAAAAATAYLYARTGEEPLAVFLNVGVAGHATRTRGELLVAHTVTDVGTGERFYPARLPGLDLDALEIRTVARPETVYESEALYDMEASGFYPVALRFSTAELVQCLKVVSDNRESPLSEWSPKAIGELLEPRIDAIAKAAEHFRKLASELDPLRRERDMDAVVGSYRRRFRFTATESRTLRGLLRRWEALDPGVEKPPETFRDASRAADVIEQLSEKLRRLFVERPL
jgi:hypothetical protein